MACSIEYDKIPHLHCIFIGKVIDGIAVFFRPDGGKERMVVNCLVSEEIECNSERGFITKLPSLNHAAINLPENFTKESGSFRCQTPELTTASCLCSPPVTKPPDSDGGPRSFTDSASTLETTDGASATNAVATGVGVSLAFVLLSIVVIITTIVLIKRKKSKKAHDSFANSTLFLTNSETVPCTSPPRLGQEVLRTGEYYKAEISLSSSQSRLVKSDIQRMFLAGPPGTGKTTVLLLKGIRWLQAGHDVHVVSTGWWSLIACRMLYYLLLQIKTKLQKEKKIIGHIYFLDYKFNDETSDVVQEAVNDLSQKAKNGYLYVIAEEARPDKYSTFTNFFNNLLEAVPNLNMWASSYYIQDLPAACKKEYLTTPFRSPPSVVREVTREKVKGVAQYSPRALSGHSDPPAKFILHQGEGHSDGPAEKCFECGSQTSVLLRSLHNCAPENVMTTPSIDDNTTLHPIQWRDILVLHSSTLFNESGFVRGLELDGIPVKLMDHFDHYEDVATAHTDVVWVANGHRVRGVERRVVVCLMGKNRENVRLCHMARCSSQLVIVDYNSDLKDSSLKTLKLSPGKQILTWLDGWSANRERAGSIPNSAANFSQSTQQAGMGT